MIQLIKDLWAFDPPIAFAAITIPLIVLAIIGMKIWEHFAFRNRP